jgi:hypothetical protein
VWLLVPLVAVWANLHGSWVLGPAFLGLTAVGRWLDGPGDLQEGRAVLQGLCVGAVAFLASAISPAGISGYLYAFGHARLPSTQFLSEWAPLDFSQSVAPVMMAVGLLLAVTATRLSRSAFVVLLPALVFGTAIWAVRRHAPFGAMVLAAGAAELVRKNPPWPLPVAIRAVLARGQEALQAWSRRGGTLAWPLAALVLLAAFDAQHPRSVRAHTNASAFPLSGLDALAQLPPGRVLTRFGWGGAVSYLDGPEYQTFIDARNDPYPLWVHQDYQRLGAVSEGWREALERYHPDYILWGGNDGARHPLLEVLACQGGWREVARDEVGVLLVRQPPKVP